MQMSSWYLTNGTWRLGPLTRDQAMAALQRPDAGGAVFAWREGFDDWLRVDTVPELAMVPPVPLAAPSAPAPQPPIPPGWPGADAVHPGHPGYVPAPDAVAAPTPFFPIGGAKLLVMTIVTFGLYEIYWFYQHWKRVRDVQDEDVSPAARAIFAILFCYPLFERVADQAADRGHAHVPSPKACAAIFILLSFTWRFPDPLWLVGLCTVLPLLSIQRAANAIALEAQPAADPNTRLTAFNWVGVVVGGLFWVLVILGMLLPEST